MLWEMLYPLDPFGFFVLFGCEGDCGILWDIFFPDSCPGLGHAAHLQQARRPTAGVLWVRGMLLAPNPGRPGLARLVTACV